MQWALSYLGANAALVSVTGLSVVALGAIAFFTKNWKAGVAAILVLAAGFAYMQIDKSAFARAQAAQAAKVVATLEGRLATLQHQTKADADRAKVDADYIEALEIAASETPPNAAACLPVDASKRVGAIR
jgi:hypothetical protein